MMERDVARVEKKLGIQLPTHYRQFLIDHGATVAKAKRKGSFVPFFTTAKEIIDANKDLRADPSLRNTNKDSETWPLKYLIIGTDGSDDWCVDLNDEREVIWLFDSEAYGTFRNATPSTWAEYLEELRSPKPAQPQLLRFFICKKKVVAADATGDGCFPVTDNNGRDWVCYEEREPTQEELLARIRGEYIPPAWLREKGLRHMSAASIEELRECLSKER